MFVYHLFCLFMFVFIHLCMFVFFLPLLHHDKDNLGKKNYILEIQHTNHVFD